MLGGTFDHLHPGHKILLSMGAWIASRKLIVGVTGMSWHLHKSNSANQGAVDASLQKKANKDIIEPFSVRIEKVRTFLKFFKPGLEYDIVPLHDVLGPTGWDPDIQALVASKETLDGAESSMFFSRMCYDRLIFFIQLPYTELHIPYQLFSYL